VDLKEEILGGAEGFKKKALTSIVQLKLNAAIFLKPIKNLYQTNQK
jgi:hypothetical protein